MKRLTKKLVEQTASNIGQLADFSPTTVGIENDVTLIRVCLKEGKTKEIEEHLNHILQCCEISDSKMFQAYHTFKMMRHLALALIQTP